MSFHVDGAINSNFSTSGSGLRLAIKDVTDGQVLTYNSTTGNWENSDGGSTTNYSWYQALSTQTRVDSGNTSTSIEYVLRASASIIGTGFVFSSSNPTTPAKAGTYRLTWRVRVNIAYRAAQPTFVVHCEGNGVDVTGTPGAITGISNETPLNVYTEVNDRSYDDPIVIDYVFIWTFTTTIDSASFQSYFTLTPISPVAYSYTDWESDISFDTGSPSRDSVIERIYGLDP